MKENEDKVKEEVRGPLSVSRAFCNVSRVFRASPVCFAILLLYFCNTSAVLLQCLCKHFETTSLTIPRSTKFAGPPGMPRHVVRYAGDVSDDSLQTLRV